MNVENEIPTLPASTTPRRYSAEALAKAAGCTRKALRVYEARGLVRRADNAKRRPYDTYDVDRLRTIVTLREAGMTLQRIANILSLVDTRPGGAQSAAAVAPALGNVVESLTEQIRVLQLVRNEIISSRETLWGCSSCDRPPVDCQACTRRFSASYL